MPGNELPKVALLINTANDFCRKVVLGVSAYSRQQGGWDFVHPTSSTSASHLPKGEVQLPDNWQGQGIIYRATSEELHNKVVASAIPAVNVSWLGLKYTDVVNVIADPNECVDVATNYFISKGCSTVAYIGVPQWQGYSNLLEKGIEEKCHTASVVFSSFDFPSIDNYESRLRSNLQEWLLTLEKPAGVITWSMDQARIIISICQAQNIDVPAEASVVCCEHDDLSAALSHIPISSINLNPTKVGFEAAKVLDGMMSGDSPTRNPLLLPAVDLIERQSSNTEFVSDAFVNRCLEFVDLRLSAGINSKTLAAELGVSTRTLEKRLRSTLGKSPAQLIDHAKIKKAKQLLLETNFSLEDIADQTGFTTTATFNRFFKRHLDVTPAQFRKRHT